MFGTPEQKERWLAPLLDARFRSAYCLTDPEVASSAASNISTTIERLDDGRFRLRGRKWWASGVLSRDCSLLLVIGVSDPHADRHSTHSILLVPRDTPGCKSPGAVGLRVLVRDARRAR